MTLQRELRQKANTRDLVIGIADLIVFASSFYTLMPGDVILTGTPEGVGMGKKPQRFLRPGDKMQLDIPGLGEQRQDVRAYPG